MTRFLAAALATVSLALLAASGAAAAPKQAVVNAGCSGGIGTPVCCKAFVAHHCDYVSCCEKGNAMFFSATHCHRCDETVAEKAILACAAKSAATPATSTAAACAPSDASCETGNRMFFTAACAAAAKAAKADCCSAKAAK